MNTLYSIYSAICDMKYAKELMIAAGLLLFVFWAAVQFAGG